MRWDHVKLNKVRKALGLTLAEMGAIIGMSSVGVHHIERGNYELKTEYVEKLENEYGFTEEKVAMLIMQYDEEQAAIGDKERAVYKIRKVVR